VPIRICTLGALAEGNEWTCVTGYLNMINQRGSTPLGLTKLMELTQQIDYPNEASQWAKEKDI